MHRTVFCYLPTGDSSDNSWQLEIRMEGWQVQSKPKTNLLLPIPIALKPRATDHMTLFI